MIWINGDCVTQVNDLTRVTNFSNKTQITLKTML